MASICFLDGARFADVQGFLRALYRAIQETPDPQLSAEMLDDRPRGRRGVHAPPICLHVVWVNSEVSRRRLGMQAMVPGCGGDNAFDAATRWLAEHPGVDLVLL